MSALRWMRWNAVGDDSIFELDVATNRPDCLSHLGVAREVSAIYGTRAPKAEVRTAGRQTDARATCSPFPLRIRIFAAVTAADTSRA